MKPFKTIYTEIDFQNIDLLRNDYKVSSKIKKEQGGSRLYEKLVKRLQRAKHRFAKTGFSRFIKKDIDHKRRLNREKVRRFRLKHKAETKPRAKMKRKFKTKNDCWLQSSEKATGGASSKRKLASRAKQNINSNAKPVKKSVHKPNIKFIPTIEQILNSLPLVVQETLRNCDRPLHSKVYI